LRITDEIALQGVKQAAGTVRLEIEAILSMGLASSPMAGAKIRVTSGNFVTAKPIGIRNGIDYQHTGEVRRIDHQAIREHLDQGALVLLSPVGYSPTGESFNLTAIEIATETAVALKADKLICLTERPGPADQNGTLLRQLTLNEARELLATQHLSTDFTAVMHLLTHACKQGVRRAHMVDRHIDGALLLELFSRDGIGTMITTDIYEGTRQATIDDLGGILELITPLEQHGVLVRRSREHLEVEIDQFTVVERDGKIIACAALHPYPDDHVGELACLVVHQDYWRSGYGESLLKYIENRAREQQIRQLFVLTTHAAHWFQERGFEAAQLRQLPIERQSLYNYQRNSKVFIKPL
jgi:amino-acid N-acetyltransferase